MVGTVTLYIAPTEPPALKRLGKYSPLVEKNGVDIFWGTKTGLVGVQRKELKDLVSSMHDGRLNKEVAQMGNRLAIKVLLVEGFGKWGVDGTLMDTWTKVTRQQVRAFLWSVRSKGVWVEWTENLNDTIQTVQWMVRYTRKKRHNALVGRPGPGGVWGRASDRDWAIHLLTSFDGVGPETASAIIDHFGQVPLRWTVEEADLLEVSGIGRVRAKKLMEALEAS